MLKDISAREGSWPYQSEDVGRSMIGTGERVSKCDVKTEAIESKAMYILTSCYRIQSE